MFTGLIQHCGTVVSVQAAPRGSRLCIAIRSLSLKIRNGQSLAVDGVCLTVEKKIGNRIFFSLMPETQQRTTLSVLQSGARVNIEFPLKASSALEGHFVQGHIDGTLLVKKCVRRLDGLLLIFSLPKKFRFRVVSLGSIALNGVSLTVAELNTRQFSVALIPETIRRTNLGDLQAGDRVNVEFDLFGKYVVQYVSSFLLYASKR